MFHRDSSLGSLGVAHLTPESIHCMPPTSDPAWALGFSRDSEAEAQPHPEVDVAVTVERPRSLTPHTVVTHHGQSHSPSFPCHSVPGGLARAVLEWNQVELGRSLGFCWKGHRLQKDKREERLYLSLPVAGQLGAQVLQPVYKPRRFQILAWLRQSS